MWDETHTFSLLLLPLEVYDHILVHEFKESFLIRLWVYARYLLEISIKQINFASWLEHFEAIEGLQVINDRYMIYEFAAFTAILVPVSDKGVYQD